MVHVGVDLWLIFRQTFGINSKSDKNIENLANDVFIAIGQERKLNNNIANCKGVITSNVGQVIQSIIDDQCND